MTKLDKLEHLARTVSEGPKWTAYAGHIEEGGQAAFAREHKLSFEDDTDGEDPSDVEERCAETDAAFIAAADPQTVLAMVEVIRSAVKMRSWYRKQMDPDGPEVTFDAALAKLEGQS
jgi:hypothetical protein